MRSDRYYIRLFNLLLLFIGVYITIPSYIALKAGAIYLSLDRIVFIFLFIYWLIGLLNFKSSIKTLAKNYKANKTIIFFLLGFLIVTLVNSIMSNSETSIVSFIYFFLYVIASFFILLTIPNQYISIPKIGKTIIFATIFVLIIFVIEVITNQNVIGSLLNRDALTEYQLAQLTDKVRGGERRVQSVFSNPLSFGQYIVMIVPILIYFTNVNFRKKKLIYLMIIALIVAGFLTKSRMVFILLVLSIIYGIYYLLIQKKVAIEKKILLLLLSISLIISMGLFLDINRFDLFGDQELLSDSNRQTQWVMAVPLISKNLYSGYGFGEGVKELGFGSLNGFGTIDNYFLTVLLDSGLIALIFFCCFLINVIFCYFRTKKNKLIIVGLIFFILNLYSLSVSQIHIIFYFLLSLFLILNNDEKTKHKKRNGHHSRQL